MNLFSRHREHLQNASTAKPGLPPGSLIHTGQQLEDSSQLRITQFNEEDYQSLENLQLDEFQPSSDDNKITWLHFTGLHDVTTIKSLGERYQLDALILEDILNTSSRPKVEIHDESVFVVANTICQSEKDQQLDVQHFALILLPNNAVLTFLEATSPLLNPVISRLKSGGGGRIRKNGSDYLAWAILDTIVDHYLYALAQAEDKLSDLDDQLQEDVDNISSAALYTAKRDTSTLHRLMRPIVDIGHNLYSADTPLLTETSRPFFRDLSDHTLQVRDSLESIREQASSLRDFHLSAVSNKMNEVMKVLTCFASIFLPLTFLAGIYGMNFDYIPELHWKWAYPTLWLVFIAMVAAMLWFFRKKKWL